MHGHALSVVFHPYPRAVVEASSDQRRVSALSSPNDSDPDRTAIGATCFGRYLTECV
ncbi:hypothetical protein T261_4741 [Streptomyces lydicus]|nr:hypothetical protein T261_4741 [Streptomyces lydicus]